MKSRRAILGLLALFVAASCGDPDEATVPSRVTHPNIVLVCLDTVRADAIDAHGDEPPAMPALAAFCSANTRFIDASAPASWTAPCVTSLLTGLSPEHHGVHGPGQSSPLVDSVTTLAESLKSAGYVTAAFTGGGWVSEERGLGQGFDTYQGSLNDAFTFEDRNGRLARWMASVDRSRPYFLFIHTYEAHDPYGRKRPPEGFDDKDAVARVNASAEDLRSRLPSPPTMDMPRGLDPVDLVVRWRSDPLFVQALSTRPGREVMEGIVLRYVDQDFAKDPRRSTIESALRARYRLGVRRVDDGFAEFLRRLDPIAPQSSTVICVTTDHGEALGEGGILGHGRYLTDVLTRIVLAVRQPGLVPALAVRGSSTHADVLPTLLALAGLPVPEGIDGISLVRLASGTAPGRPVEAEEYRKLPEGGEMTILRLVSARDENAKFVATLHPRTGEIEEQLFDLKGDPAELHPMSVTNLTAHGATFVTAVAHARARIAAIAKEVGAK